MKFGIKGWICFVFIVLVGTLVLCLGFYPKNINTPLSVQSNEPSVISPQGTNPEELIPLDIVNHTLGTSVSEEKYEIVSKSVSGYTIESSKLSDKMATISKICSGCVDVLQHIYLMSGNALSEDQLFDMAGRKGPSNPNGDIDEAYFIRLGLRITKPDYYQTLSHYETNVSGTLLSTEEIQELIESPGFDSYRDSLINIGIISDFCVDNPNSIACLKKAAIEEGTVEEFCMDQKNVWNICDPYKTSS